MLRCDRAGLDEAAWRRRALLVALALSLVGGLAGAPFVLAGCTSPVPGDPLNTVRNLEVGFSGSTQTLSGSGEATALPAPIVDGVSVGIVAPSGVTPTTPVVTHNGDSLSIVGAGVTVTATLAAELEAAGVYSPPGEVLFAFETAAPLTISNGDQFTFSVQQIPPGPATTSNRLGGGGMLRSDLDDGPPYDTFQYVDNPVAFVLGGNPGVQPAGAAAWKTQNTAVGHGDGPFALPGQPNPDGLQVLDPIQITTLGPFWANPDACAHIHAHGAYTAAPAHSDPQPPVCGHGALLYLPHVTSGPLSPPDGAYVSGGGHVTLTANPTTTGFGIDRVEFLVDSALVGTATSDPWSIVYSPPTVTITAAVPWTARAIDHNGRGATATAQLLNVSAPLDLFVSGVPSAVIGGGSITVTAQLTGGLPPLAVDLEVDDVIVDTQTGTSPFVLTFSPPVPPEAYLAAMRVIGRDSVTLTASPYLDVVVAPPLGGSFSLSRAAVVAGGSVTVTANQLVGLPPYTVTFLADDVPFDTQVGTGSTFFSTFTTPLEPATQIYQLRASVVDGIPQSVTITASQLRAVGTEAPPFVVLTEPAAGLEVIEGYGVTITAEVVGGVGGVGRVDFFGNDVPIGADVMGGDGFGILWVASPIGGSPTHTSVPVDLRAVAEDGLGQAASSEPVGILVLRAMEIPALGGAALGALAALIAGVGVWARLRRRS